MEEPIKSVTGYSCPNCDTTCSYGLDGSYQSSTEREFVVSPHGDPSYQWVETHKCTNCGTTYILNNGT